MMLPRGFKLVNLLHIRSHLSHHQILNNNLNLRFYTHQSEACKRLYIESRRHVQSTRQYSSKEKILAAPTNPSLNSNENAKKTQDQEEVEVLKLKSASSGAAKCTQNTIGIEAKAHPKQETDTESRTSTKEESLLQNSILPKPKKRSFEIKTSKGILSVTTTIEDSKINEVVFEKSQTAAKTKSLPTKPTSIKSEKCATEIVKEYAESTLKETKDEEAKAKVEAEPKAKAPQTVSEKIKSVAAVIMKTSEKAVDTSAAENVSTAAPPTPPSPKPKRAAFDFNRSSVERNFITPTRAVSDFLLSSNDLETLPKIKRRSPYEQEPPITVYWRKDVEAKAIEVWGSREKLLGELLKRELERKKHQQNIFTVKRRLRDYRREIGSRTVVFDDEPGLKGKSGKVVLIAIGINGVNFLFKVCGWLCTGSHSMFSEAIHSLADTSNQLILAYGIHKSTQVADQDHPYGYANMKYVSSLISGVGIFCVGAGLSYYHGITGLMHPEPLEDLFWAFFILGGSLVSEGATLLVAINRLRRSAKLEGVSFKEYVWSGKDPCVNVVLTEDAAAVTSVAVAAACMGLTTITGSPVFDAVGSLFVGTILGGVASFIIYTNVAALVGKSISEERLNKINSELENDIMIRAIHDVKGIDMGNSLVRYKAEMDFDGRELTRSYLDKQDLNELLKVIKSFQTTEEVEMFLLNHGENIVDLMGGEIDRIEMKLRKKFPEIRHCDLEIL